MDSHLLRFIVGLCVCGVYVNAQYKGSPCTTPNGESASCISIYDCKVLVAALYNQDRATKDFLQKSQCGFDEQVLVCCGQYASVQRASGNPNRYSYTNRGSGGGGGGNRRPSGGNAGPKRTSLVAPNMCGRQTTNKLYNGEETDVDEFPWMALLEYRKNGKRLGFYCGGTLISNRYVLTAAHCVTGASVRRNGELYSVRLGEHNIQTDPDCSVSGGCAPTPMDIVVEKNYPHPGYNDGNINRYNDIALVRLSRDVQFSEYVRPICLPTGKETINVGDRLSVAGWGYTEYNVTSPVKLKLALPIADQSQCVSMFKEAMVNLRTSQLCAGGEKGKDSCKGDSGGPLMTTMPNNRDVWYQEGIVSFGTICGTEGWPGIYTKVASYIDWILETAV